MEFLPIEKYSLDRKTGKHKKDVVRAKKKSALKEVKAERKGKPIKSATAVVEEEEKSSKSEEDISESEDVQQESARPTRYKTVASNRLFVNMKKKIMNIQEVKDLHPDIISITLPRKKYSRWCWAVFESKEKAVKALKVLKKKEDIIVNQMFSEEFRKERMDKKMKKMKSKKSMKKTLKDAWM